MAITPSQPLVDFWVVICESKRIINAHSRHFLALSVLFLLPLSFSISVFPTLIHTFTSPEPNHIESLLRLSNPLNPHPHHHHNTNLHHNRKTLTFALLFSTFILFLSISAVGSITFSVFHGFYGRPVKLISAITSIFTSFLPLLVTLIAAQVVIFLIFTLFGLFEYLAIKSIELFQVGFSYNSPYFIGVSLIGMILFGVILFYVMVTWSLVNVIVVVESKWGFEPMVRSKDLVRGMTWVSLSLIMFFGFFEVMLLSISMVSGGGDSGSVSDGWRTWGFILQIVVISAVLTLLMLHNIAASTVLYMHCKASHGELAWEIANEFAAEYLSLPFDGKKAPHIVYYVH